MKITIPKILKIQNRFDNNMVQKMSTSFQIFMKLRQITLDNYTFVINCSKTVKPEY